MNIDNKIEQFGNIKLFNGDCMEFMKTIPDNYFELAIVDPPYGININMNMGLKRGKRKRHKNKSWDSEVPNAEYFEELFRVSQNQIIWGGNYFELPANNHFIFWNKYVPEGLSFSDGEYAWTSFNKANRMFSLRNIGNNKIHPTEKPIQLYKWILANYAKQGDKILDTHFGSLSIGIACHDLGFDLTSCELDKDYYEAGKKRLKQHQSQTTLF